MSLEAMFRGDELVPGALRGYRTWKTTSDGRLASTAIRHVYGPPGTIEQAACHPYSSSRLGDAHGPAPCVACACGFYGWYAPADSRIVPAETFGVVEATGRVVLGSHGFRAERLRVVAVTTEDRARLDALAAAGFQTYGSRDELLADYAPDDMSGLITHRCDRHCWDVTPLTYAHAWAVAQSVTQQSLTHLLRVATTTAQTVLARLAGDGGAQPDEPAPSRP